MADADADLFSGLVEANAADVKFRRESAGLTQQQFADKYDIGKRTLEKIEAGRSIRAETLRQVAKVFGCDWRIL